MSKTAKKLLNNSSTGPPQGNIYNPECSARSVLDRVADKWIVIVVRLLATQTLRFGELHRGIRGISQKTLTQTLRRLENDGLVERKVYAVVPPMVEYRLTSLGLTFVPVCCAICDWVEQYASDVEALQQG